MKKLFFYIALNTIISNIFAQQLQPEISITLKFKHDNFIRELQIGRDPIATDAIDYQLGECELPPFPPMFDLRFVSDNLGEGTYKDFRNGEKFSKNIYIHQIKYANLNYSSQNSSSIIFYYHLPKNVALVVKDPLNGSLYNDTLKNSGEYKIKYVNVFNTFTIIALFEPEDDLPNPVTLYNFNASQIENKIVLKWITASEINNYGFCVERKGENEDWQNLGFVKGKGNSNSYSYYEFIDENNLKSGKFFYRLKQIDKDGKYEYLQTTEASYQVDDIIDFKLNGVYPNPFNSSAKISINLTENAICIISIYNSLGQLLSNKKEELKAGNNEIILEANSFSTGSYILSVETQNKISYAKFVVVK